MERLKDTSTQQPEAQAVYKSTQSDIETSITKASQDIYNDIIKLKNDFEEKDLEPIIENIKVIDKTNTQRLTVCLDSEITQAIDEEKNVLNPVLQINLGT